LTDVKKLKVKETHRGAVERHLPYGITQTYHPTHVNASRKQTGT